MLSMMEYAMSDTAYLVMACAATSIHIIYSRDIHRPEPGTIRIVTLCGNRNTRTAEQPIVPC